LPFLDLGSFLVESLEQDPRHAGPYVGHPCRREPANEIAGERNRARAHCYDTNLRWWSRLLLLRLPTGRRQQRRRQGGYVMRCVNGVPS
jgi:hypothetical protein